MINKGEIKMEHKCFNCGSFEAYYSKGYCCFLRADCGHCKKFGETKQKHFYCESWRSRYYPAISSGRVLKELETALTQINGIKLILDERLEDLNADKN